MNRKRLFEKIVGGANLGILLGAIIGNVSFPYNYYVLGVTYADEIPLALGNPSYAPSTEGLTLNSILLSLLLAQDGFLLLP